MKTESYRCPSCRRKLCEKVGRNFVAKVKRSSKETWEFSAPFCSIKCPKCGDTMHLPPSGINPPIIEEAKDAR